MSAHPARQLVLAFVLPLMVASSPASARPPAEQAPPPRGTYVIVHPAALADAAAEWAEYRRSDRWIVHREVAPADGTDETRRLAVRERIANRHRAHVETQRGPFMVLLLGDADAVPPYRVAQTDPLLQDPRDVHFATDHPYQQLRGNDELPDVPLGRVPVATVPEALAVLEKVRRYERTAPPGAWRRRINYAAGEGRFGGLDVIIELLFRGMLAQLVPDRFDPSLTYAKAGSVFCPPPDRINDVMLERLGEGALLFNYLGHGSARHLDRMTLAGRELTLMRVEDLDRLPVGGSRLPIALLTCCSAGWFDLPGDEQSLAEAMLVHPGGPVAVIAGSRPTHPYANAVLQKDVTELLLKHRIETVGELDLLATRSMLRIDVVDRQIDLIAAPLALTGGWSTSLRGLRRMHVQLYNLLGDPALRIAHPGSEVGGLALSDGRVRGQAGRVWRGRVELTLEIDPAMSGLPGSAGPATPGTGYDRANDRTLLRLDGTVQDGVFSVALPEVLPPDATVIKAYAVGADDGGRPVDAFGAMRLHPGASAVPRAR